MKTMLRTLIGGLAIACTAGFSAQAQNYPTETPATDTAALRQSAVLDAPANTPPSKAPIMGQESQTHQANRTDADNLPNADRKRMKKEERKVRRRQKEADDLRRQSTRKTHEPMPGGGAH